VKTQLRMCRRTPSENGRVRKALFGHYVEL
jgi:hypothetical protein